MDRFAKYQSIIALACVALVALDALIPSIQLPAAVEHLAIAVAAALGVSRPSEMAARLAASRSVPVALALLAALASKAMAEPEAPIQDLDPAVVSGESSDSGGGSGGSSTSG